MVSNQAVQTISKLSWAPVIADLGDRQGGSHAVKAALTLAEIASETHVPELYTLLQHDDCLIREAVANPLASLEGVKALPALLEALTQGLDEGHDNDTLSATIGSLLAANEQKAAPILLEMLTSTEAEMRANAAWGLGFVAAVIEPDPLLDTLANDPCPEVRAEAAGALRSFQNNPHIVANLVMAMEDEDERVRISAIHAAGHLGDIEAVRPLLEKLEKARPLEQDVIKYALGLLDNMSSNDRPTKQKLWPQLWTGKAAILLRIGRTVRSWLGR